MHRALSLAKKHQFPSTFDSAQVGKPGSTLSNGLRPYVEEYTATVDKPHLVEMP